MDTVLYIAILVLQSAIVLIASLILVYVGMTRWHQYLTGALWAFGNSVVIWAVAAWHIPSIKTWIGAWTLVGIMVAGCAVYAWSVFRLLKMLRGIRRSTQAHPH
jgi:hypothetical protein